MRSKWYQHHQRKKQQTPVFIQSTLMVQLLLTSFLTKQQLVRLGGEGGGRCFRRDWMARLISTVAWPIARMGLVTWTENFGWDWTGFTVWQQWKTSSGRILQPSSETLRMYFTTYFPVRGLSTSSALENIQVITVDKIEKNNKITFKNMITFISCRYESYLRLKYLATGLNDILKQALIRPLPYASFPKRGLVLNHSYEITLICMWMKTYHMKGWIIKNEANCNSKWPIESPYQV